MGSWEEREIRWEGEERTGDELPSLHKYPKNKIRRAKQE